MQDIKIITIQGELIALLDGHTSFRGDVSLREVGACELHINLGAKGAIDISKGHLIYLAKDRVWRITGIEIDEGDTYDLKVTGEQLKGILAQRLVLPSKKGTEELYGWERFPDPNDPEVAAETVMRHYVTQSCIDPEESTRIIDELTLRDDMATGLPLRWSARFEQLDKVLEAIGQQGEVGWDVIYDIEAKEAVFVAVPYRNQVEGSDKPVIFSIEFENLASLKYKDSTKDFINYVYAGGAGTDEDRLIIGAGYAASGLDRYETWADCGSAQNVDDLAFEARHKLEQFKRQESLTGEALDSKSFVYRRDWDIGSIVTIRSKALGVSIDQLITSVREVYEKGTMTVTPTFGERQKTIIDEIRKKETVR